MLRGRKLVIGIIAKSTNVFAFDNSLCCVRSVKTPLAPRRLISHASCDTDGSSWTNSKKIELLMMHCFCTVAAVRKSYEFREYLGRTFISLQLLSSWEKQLTNEEAFSVAVPSTIEMKPVIGQLAIDARMLSKVRHMLFASREFHDRTFSRASSVRKRNAEEKRERCTASACKLMSTKLLRDGIKVLEADCKRCARRRRGI